MCVCVVIEMARFFVVVVVLFYRRRAIESRETVKCALINYNRFGGANGKLAVPVAGYKLYARRGFLCVSTL